MNKKRLFGIAILVLCALNLYGKRLHTIPFKLVNDRICLHGQLNGKPCILLYDTGDFDIAIDSLFASKSGIVKGSLGKQAPLSFEFGDFKTQGIFYRVNDCQNFSSSKVDGVVGINFFGDKVVEIDYANEQLNVYEKGEILEGYERLDAESTFRTYFMGSFITPATITLSDSSTFTGRFIIDTGSGRNITLLTHVPIKIKKDYYTVKCKNASHYGHDESKYFRISSFTFNNRSYKNLISDISMDDNGGSESVIDGIIGGEFLRNFKLLIDFEGRVMYLKENPYPKASRSTFCSDGIGFTTRKDDLGGLLVTSFVVHPTLSKTKIKLNDLIIAVNHVEVTSKEYNELKSKFWVEGATPIYTVKRGNKIFEVQTEVKRIL